MAHRDVELVEGWTGDLDFQLKSQNEHPDGTMSGMTVELILINRSTGAEVTIGGTVTVVDQNQWKIRYSPSANDLVEGTYHGRFKVTDAGSKVAYFPSGEPDLWKIWAAPA